MPEELVDDVFDLTCRPGPEPERIRAFLTASGTLFDTGLPDTTDWLLAEINDTGVDVERVVITHADGDHVGGLDAVTEAHDSEVYLPVGADPEVASEVDHYYGEGDVIDGFEAVHLPGHRGHQHGLVDESHVVSDAEQRAGSAEERERRGVAVLGDALSGSDQRGFPAGRFHLPPGVYTDDLLIAEESLEKLLDYEFEVGLLYHGTSVLEDARQKLGEYVYGLD